MNVVDYLGNAVRSLSRLSDLKTECGLWYYSLVLWRNRIACKIEASKMVDRGWQVDCLAAWHMRHRVTLKVVD